MNNENLYHIQEGLHVSELIKQKFQLSEKDLSGQDNSSKCNFTGMIIKSNDILISWPKHFFKSKDLYLNIEKEPKLLFDILVKYMDITEECYLNDESKDDKQESYPLRAFQNILSYYKKYGLYREETTIEKQGYSGNIDWKKTASKSSKVISNGKLLFLPFVIKNRKTENVFISECMAYAINETFSLLSFILPNRTYIDIWYDRDLFLNKEFILVKLKSFKGKIFKDINKKLINDLITFFEMLGNVSEFKYKNYYFSSIWEKMITEYINRNLFFMDANGYGIQENCKVFNFEKQKFDIGNRQIEVDHYYEDEASIYILDSKYYHTVRDLNYKQVAYDYFLRKEEKITVNALIMPFHEKVSTNHFMYKEDNILIAEHYFVVQDVMRDCASN